jgi:hypothetical protein
MNNEVTLTFLVLACCITMILYKIWGCLEDIAKILDQATRLATRLDDIERRIDKPLDGDEWKNT